jgi:RNA polymerase sigma-70 factor (ECF subfamily)
MPNKEYIIDEQLVLRYQSGDLRALPKLVERWHKQFCKKAFWIIKDADVSKDIAQESWKTIIDNINTLKDAKSFSSWAMRIVCSRSFDWIREQSRNKNKLDSYKQNYNSDATEVVSDQTEIKKLLIKAVSSLPEQQQVVIRLFYVEDYSLKEMSDILNISVGTTKSRLFHAREKLKKQLKNRTYEN